MAEVVGRVSNPGVVKPIELDIAGYTVDGEEVLTRVRFKAHAPFGKLIALMGDGIDPDRLRGSDVVQVLLAATYSEEDESALRDLFESRDVEITYETLNAIYTVLSEHWSSDRPPARRPSSPGGGRPTRPTSEAGASRRGSGPRS